MRALDDSGNEDASQDHDNDDDEIDIPEELDGVLDALLKAVQDRVNAVWRFSNPDELMPQLGHRSTMVGSQRHRQTLRTSTKRLLEPSSGECVVLVFHPHHRWCQRLRPALYC